MIKLYYHLALINNWMEVTDFFFESVISSGLYEKCDSIEIIFVGSKDNEPKFKFSSLKKINIKYGGELNKFEFPTLKKLWEESFSCDSNIFYFHSKGVSFDEKRWDSQKDTIKKHYSSRNYKSYSDVKSAYFRTRYWLRRCLIEQFENCLSCLEEKDIVCLSHKSNLKFFPSNFWWSKSSYIQNLSSPVMKKDRYDAEMWTFKDGVKVHSFIGKNDEYKMFML